ncbi:MAG TPA: hypothetical protein VET25_04865 [Aestuariivirgaceae bacterium]|nr:hypothetical protein [Aestuariivirgaceae bacterium]
MEKQAQRVDENMPLLALDQFTSVEAMSINTGPPCMGLFLSRSLGRVAHLFLSSVSLFDLKARFFVPTRASLAPARAGAVKVGRRTNVAACSALARPHLDGFEHDGTLGAAGMTIGGEPAFRARINRATTLYPVGPGPKP